MEAKELQELCVEVVKKIDKRYKIKRDSQLGLSQLMEEIGELAKALNFPKLRNKKIDQNNLESEFANVFILLSILASMHDVDFEKATKKKITELNKRHKL